VVNLLTVARAGFRTAEEPTVMAAAAVFAL
jgi:hypothetical protein